MLPNHYFKDHELTCSCGCGRMPDKRSVEMLYAVRIIVKVPLIIISPARCPAYNKKVKGSKNSTHMIGAFDVQTKPKFEWKLVRAAQDVGFTGIGIRDNVMIHLDRHHKKPVIWTYK